MARTITIGNGSKPEVKNTIVTRSPNKASRPGGCTRCGRG